MNRILTTSLAVACIALPVGAGETMPKKPPARKPFFDARRHQPEYSGPGRELPAPNDIEEVRIGYFGPSDPAHPQGGDMWRAAQLAIDQANARGGYRRRGKPFRLVAAWSKDPWGSGVSQLARMVYVDKVWGIIGGIDGVSTHLAEQVVTKARLVLISPGSTDKTVNLINVPWMFSCLPGDHVLAPLLAAEIERRVGKKAFVLVTTNDHDSHLFAVELEKALTGLRLVPRYHFVCKPASEHVDELTTRVIQSKPHVVVLIAGAGDSARLLRAIRERGFTGPVFGGPAMGRREFLRQAGAAAEKVVFPLLYDPPEAAGQIEQASSGRLRFGPLARGNTPDYAAAATYDAVGLMIAAIEKAGLNRARIRDAVRELSPWTGVTGAIEWDPSGSNRRAVCLGTITGGRVTSL